MALFEILTKRRVELGISLDEIVIRSGVPKGTVSKIMSGNTPNPQIESLKAIAYALNLTLDDLYEPPNNPAESEYSRENYNGLNAEEARQFARGVSKAAMNVALMYDKLDEHGQEAVRTIAEIEYSRMDLDIMSKGIDILDVIGAKRLGDVHGLPHYEAGDPNVANARYFSRNEQLEMAKDAAPDPVITDRSCIDQEMNPDHP